MTDIEFQKWPDTKRLFREIVVTEKIDGTNAAIIVTNDGRVAAQSRRRLVTPEDDNYGFGRWVHENADSLVQILGPGRHFGEWWGAGVQRHYDMTEKRFSLFDPTEWQGEIHSTAYGDITDAVIDLTGGSISAVPILYRGEFSEAEIVSALGRLRDNGSVVAPGFMKPEGICVWHSQTRSTFKVTLDNQDRHKWEAMT